MQLPPGMRPVPSAYPESSVGGHMSMGVPQNNPFLGASTAPSHAYQMSAALGTAPSPCGYHHASSSMQGCPTPPMPFPGVAPETAAYAQQPGALGMPVFGSPTDVAQPQVTSKLTTTVKPPRPRYQGATEFYGSVPKKHSTFAWTELCATPQPECSLAPVPQVMEKTWYNTYIFRPAEKSHPENQFLERFVQGPDGEWLDIVKAKRMSGFIEERREQAMRQQMERAMIMSGSVVHHTDFTDAYSGEALVACRGELLPKEALLEEAGIHRNAKETAQMLVEEAKAGFDFDNLRVPWAFGAPHRNKKISQHAYDWFDRHNPYIPTDRHFQMVELPSMYVDAHQYHRFDRVQGANALAGGNRHVSIPDHALDPTEARQQQVQHVVM